VSASGLIVLKIDAAQNHTASHHQNPNGAAISA